MSNRLWVVGALLLAHCVAAAETPLAFPGAVGAAAPTPGGRGGEIIRVTTLAASGPGSFVDAVRRPGKRIVVFEVGGVIDLAESTVKITEPYLTIAGQTAPAPGITLIHACFSMARAGKKRDRPRGLSLDSLSRHAAATGTSPRRVTPAD